MTYLDTHSALWLCTRDVALSDAALREIESGELRLSPMAILEMQLLQEIGRLNAPPARFVGILKRDFEVTVCSIPFHAVVEAAIGETWTRDPFDRVIVAQARFAKGKLITRDRKILEHFPGALW